MSDQHVRFISTVGRGIDVDIPSDEPSHIHIPRPSRLRRRGPGSSVQTTDELRDRAADDGVAQAA